MKILLSLILIFVCAVSYSQITYLPSLGTVSNKPYSPGAAVPTDGRTYLFDPTYQLWRPYISTAEVLSYLNLSKYRIGQFDIVINQGGSLSGGIIVGGVNSIWYFKNGTANSDLVLKNAVSTVNGQSGTVVVKNADSLLGRRIDTGSVANNGYYLTYDSTNKKFVLIQPSAGYVAGTGILIVGNVISATNTSAIWNATSLKGRSITSAAPVVGTVPTWTGTQFDFLPSGSGGSAILSGYISADTLYLVSASDSIKIPNTARKTYVDSLFSNFTPPNLNFDATFYGTGTGPDPIKADTTIYYFTQTQAATRFALDKARIDSIVNNFPAGGVTGGKTKLISNSNGTDSIFKKINDSLYVIKKPVSGANTTAFTTDSTFGFNASPGTAEVNTDAFTLVASGTRSVLSGLVIDYVEVNPTSDLNQFKMGTSTDDDAYIFATPCAGGKWTLITCNSYFPAGSTVYFAGITSSTQIKVHKQIQHE